MSQQASTDQDNPKKPKRGPRNYVPSIKPAVLSLPGLMKYLDKSKTWVFQAVADGILPRPIKWGDKNSNSWIVAEIDAAIEKERQKRDLEEEPDQPQQSEQPGQARGQRVRRDLSTTEGAQQ